MELRYLGFDQRQNTRAYRFKRVAKGEPAMYLIVTADLQLFLLHHVGIQEGPVLCAQKLGSDLQSNQHGNHELTNEDMLAHANARAIADARKEAERIGRRRQPALQSRSISWDSERYGSKGG